MAREVIIRLPKRYDFGSAESEQWFQQVESALARKLKDPGFSCFGWNVRGYNWGIILRKPDLAMDRFGRRIERMAR